MCVYARACGHYYYHDPFFINWNVKQKVEPKFSIEYLFNSFFARDVGGWL